MELPDDITHLANKMLNEGYCKRSMSFRQIFTGPIVNGIPWAWDVTDYQPHGPKGRVVDDINRMIDIARWERTRNAGHVDMKYAGEICIKKAKPALIVVYKDPNTGKIMEEIADGNHRIAKANMLRMRQYPAHALTLEESEAIRLPDELAIRTMVQ